jgi:hypothetical protein
VIINILRLNYGSRWMLLTGFFFNGDGMCVSVCVWGGGGGGGGERESREAELAGGSETDTRNYLGQGSS